MTFVGFDLHQRDITSGALNDVGEIPGEIRKLSAAIEAVSAWQCIVWSGHGLALRDALRGMAGRTAHRVRAHRMRRACLSRQARLAGAFLRSIVTFSARYTAARYRPGT